MGSIGCFVRRNGLPGFISNNHVLAGENLARVGDHIVQPGTVAKRGVVGRLEAAVKLLYSPPGSKPHLNNVTWNDVDVALAVVDDSIRFSQSYLPNHTLPPIKGLGVPRMRNERVFKVGQGSGLTRGRVVANKTIVAVQYRNGLCWFKDSFEIEGDFRPFSQSGDSGAVVVNGSGEILGILYAANPTAAYACPIDTALQTLNCMLL
jgi:hypothetical protein